MVVTDISILFEFHCSNAWYFLQFACTLVSHFTAMITNIFCGFSIKVAGLKQAISPAGWTCFLHSQSHCLQL